MSDDITERLNRFAERTVSDPADDALIREVISEIERLRADLASAKQENSDLRFWAKGDPQGR